MGIHESPAAFRAIEIVAPSCHQRHDLAEPLWFAVMCRALWDANAAKELQFVLQRGPRPALGRSDRTSRAWATGESEPPASVLLALLLSDHGWRVLEYLLRNCLQSWWLRLVERIGKLNIT